MSEEDIKETRKGAFGIVAGIVAGTLLLASMVDFAYTSYYILKLVAEKNLNIPIFVFVLLFINMWFINNIRLKASVFLFGHSDSDDNIVNIAGDMLSKVGNTLKNETRDAKESK